MTRGHGHWPQARSPQTQEPMKECPGCPMAPAPDGTQLASRTYALIYCTPDFLFGSTQYIQGVPNSLFYYFRLLRYSWLTWSV